MKEKQLPLVTFEQAKRLKALGFDWECIGYYWINRNIGKGYETINHNKYDDTYSAPTVALALKWIRDEKTELFEVIYTTMISQWDEAGESDFDTYEAAESALLDESLNILEKEK